MVAKNLKAIRRSQGLTQQQVADHAGINRTTYANYEQGGGIPDDTLESIALALGVTVDGIRRGASPDHDVLSRIKKLEADVNDIRALFAEQAKLFTTLTSQSQRIADNHFRELNSKIEELKSGNLGDLADQAGNGA